MALKNFKDQKFRKKDGMPYGYKPMAEEETREAQYNMAQQVEQPTNDNTQSIAELRKARNNPGMQEYLNSEEHKRKQREYRQRALELARSKSSSNSDAKPNAGDDRTTAYKQPQTVSVGTTGLGILPTYSGMNIASNGADVDPEKYNTPAIKGTPTVSEEDSFQNAKKKVNKYLGDKELEGILNNYAKTYAAQEEATATSALGWKIYEPLKKAMFGNDLEEYKNQFMKKTGVSEDEFNDIAEHYIYYINTKATEALQDEMDEKSLGEKLALTPIASMASITGNALGIISTNNSQTKAEDIGRNYNSGSFAFKNYGNAVKESVNKDISGYYDENGNRVEGLVDEEKHPVLNKVATTLYNVPTMAGESVVTAMYPMGLGTSFYASGTYADTLREDENRGLTEEQALKHASIMGTAEYLLEKTPVAHLSEVFSKGNGNRSIKSLILRQMREEGQEEIGGDVVDVISDALISGDKSKLNQTIALYQSQEWADNYNNGIPLSKEEATKRAWKEWGLNSVNDYVMASLSAGLSVGAGASYNAGVEAHVGRKIAKDTELTDSMLNNAESQEYIANTREAYNTDEDYNKALETRQKLQQAAEQAAQKKRISGKAARAITSGVREAYDNMNAKARVVFQQQVEAAQEEAEKENRVDEYKTPEKTQEEIIEDIEYASTPYQLAKAIESVTDETEDIKELIDYKKQELETYNFKAEDVENAITPKKAFEMGQRGEEVTEEQLKSIPEVDRQEVLENNNIQYNKAVLREHPDAVVDRKTGKYFVPEEVKVNGSDIVVVDSEGNEHVDFTNPRISKVENIFSKVSKNYETGRPTGESLYNTTVQQAAYATEMAIKSPEATPALIATAAQRIFDSASVGNKTWSEFVDASHGLFTTIDQKSAEKLFNDIRNQARKSDSQKAENTEGKRTHNETVSKTLKENLNEESVALLEAFGKKIGYDFVASKSKNARGDINPSTRTISVGTNNISELWSIATHEGIAEYLQAHGNEADVLAIQDDMLNYLENKLGTIEYNNLIDTYQAAYRTGAKEGSVDAGKSRRAAANEMFNDTVFALMSSEEGLNDFIDWVTDNKTTTEQLSILQRVKDFFSKIFDFIQNYIDSGSFNAAEKAALEMDAKQAKEFRDRIFKAMDEAIANAKNSTLIQLDGIEGYTEKKINNWKDSKNIKVLNTVGELISFIDDSLDNKGESGIKGYLGTIDSKLAKRIKDSTGIDIKGFNLTLRKSEIRKIVLNSHGNEQEENLRGQRAVLDTDLLSIPSIIAEADSIELDKKLFEGKPVIIFRKTLNNRETVTTYVSFKHHDLTVQTMYLGNKKSLATTPSATKSSFSQTSETLSGTAILDSSITSESENSTEKMSKNDEESVNNVQGPKSIKVDTNGRSSKNVGDIEQEAIEHFGTTDNFRVAGYMLADGSMLDFSGAHWLEGESPEYIADWKSKNDIRQVDHEDITEVFDDDDAYYKFVDERGNIRLMPESPGVSISSTVEPTAAQYRQLKEFIREAKTNPNYNNYDFFVDVGAKNPKKLAYRNNINENRVVNDIKKYYETGEVSQNALNDFRYSIKVDTEGRSLSDDQQAFYADEHPVFTKDGALKVYYHGSENAGFTEFNVNFADDNISLFVTDSLTVAKGYSGTSDIFDPDGEWNIEKLDRFLSFMTGGELYVEQNGDKYDITELGMIGEDDKVTSFNSLKEAQAYAVDYVNKLDIRGNNSAANYKLYVHATNPLIVDVKGNEWNEIPVDSYAKHYQGVDIVDNGGIYEVDYQDGNDFKHEVFNSREELEANFGKFYESFDAGEIYLEDLYLDENNQRIPTNTREYATFAKEQGYDSVVFNDIYDNAIYATRSEMEKSSQVVIVFNANQLKSVYNEHPTVDSDIRKSIKIDWDTHNSYEVPARTYEDTVGFFGTDEEIEAADQQDLAVKSYYANIIHSKKFAGLMFEYKDGDRTKQNFLTRSTRKGYDWQYSYGYDNEPYGHNNYKDENDVVETYGSVWGDDMTSLYQELLEATPKEGVKVHVVREGIAEDARNSFKVYGEASPYADSISESRVVAAMIGSMNKSLQQADVFTMPNDELLRLERYITNKYKVDMNSIEEGEIAANISYAFAYMQKNKLDTDYDNMMNYLLNVGDEIIKNSSMKDPLTEEIYNSTRAKIAGHYIKLTDADRAEISNAFGGSWKAAFGAINKAGIRLDNKNGIPVDDIFSEIKQEVLETAGIDLTEADKPSQQILTLIDTMTALEPTAYLWDGANDMDKALTVVADIVEQYYAAATEQLEKNVIKGTKEGKAKVKKAVDKESARLRGEWAKYKKQKQQEFNEIVAEKNRLIQKQQNEIRHQKELMKKWDADQKEKNKQDKEQKILTKKQMKQTARLQAQQAVQSYKDRQERAKQIDNIKKTGVRLIKWLTNPTDTQHVPDFLQKPLGEFLAAIDFLPSNAKADAKNTLTWQQRMNSLREVLKQIEDAERNGENTPQAYFAQNIVAKELISMMDDFLGKETWDEYTQSYIVDKRAATKVSRLDAKDLATLNKIMSALSASINNMNKTYANDQFKEITSLARTSVKEIDKLPEKKARTKAGGTIEKLLKYDELEPITYFECLGNGAKSVFQELRYGFNIKTGHIREADEYMTKVKKDLGVANMKMSDWKNQTKVFNLVEGKIELTTTQIMSLYEILKRKQGKPHVAIGGIKAGDVYARDENGKFIKKTKHQAKAVHIMSSEAQAIIDTLTDEQKALADAMQQFMANECSSWGNRVTQKMYGYKKFEESDYFPLKTDSNTRATTASTDNNVSYYTIKNASFTKAITPMANNAVVVDDIFDVFTDHVVKMADYDAYVMPIADAMRWFNYSEKLVNAVAPDELNEAGQRVDYIGNMQESIDRVMGNEGLQYFRQFIKDINGDYAGRGGVPDALNSLMGMYKAAAVGANVRVIIQQPTAVIRAADVIESKYLLEAMTTLPMAMKYAEKAQANSEIAYWKAQGYYETYLGQSFKEIITGDKRLRDYLTDAAGWAAGKADDLSWGIMYHAAELKVRKTMPELKVDSAEYTKEVVKLFEDIVDHTQVVDTIFHKSQYMRNQGLGYKITSAFMAEPTKTYNMLYRSYFDARYSGKGKVYGFKKLSKVATIFIFEQMVNAIVTALWDSLRDDEKENYIEGFKKAFAENAIDNVIILPNLIPIAKDIVSFFHGYDATSYIYDGLESLVDTITADKKYITNWRTGEKQSKTTYGISYQNAKAFSQLTGVPVANIMRDATAIYNAVNDIWEGEDLVKSTKTQKKAEETKAQQYFHEGFTKNDIGAMNNIYKDAINAGKSESDAWSDVRDAMEIEFKSQISEPGANVDVITKHFKDLLLKTKYDNGERYMSEKEVENKLNKWLNKSEE